MKHAALLALPFAILAGQTAPLTAQEPFEGTVSYRMMAQGQAMEMTHYVKGKDIRVELSAMGQSVVVLTDTDGEKQIMMMPEMKQYMDLKAMMAAMGRGGMTGGAEQEQTDVDSLDIRATGQKETIAGHECEHYIITADGDQVDICAATGLGWYIGSPDAMGGMSAMGRGRGGVPGGQGVPGLSNAQIEEWRQRFSDGFFPLKITANQDGTSVSIEATSIEKKTLDAALFVPPSDYTRMGGGGD